MKVYFASDHAGFVLKSLLVAHVQGLGHEIEDMGAHVLNEDDDYPRFVTPLAQRVAKDSGALGIVIGASGQGEAMAANRISGVRAAVYYGARAVEQHDAAGHILNMIQSVRTHNNANILSLGARFLSQNEAKEAVQVFLKTPFSGETRHLRRIAQLDD